MNGVHSMPERADSGIVPELPERCDSDNGGVDGTVFKPSPCCHIVPSESAIDQGELIHYRRSIAQLKHRRGSDSRWVTDHGLREIAHRSRHSFEARIAECSAMTSGRPFDRVRARHPVMASAVFPICPERRGARHRCRMPSFRVPRRTVAILLATPLVHAILAL